MKKEQLLKVTRGIELICSIDSLASAIFCLLPPFPVTGEQNAYWVDANAGAQGPGMYETAVAIDHMDGYLFVDIITHVGGNDAIDIPVSDALEEIIDTFEVKTD